MKSSIRFPLGLAALVFAAGSAVAQSDANPTARPNTPEDQPQPSSVHKPTDVPTSASEAESDQDLTSSSAPVADAWITMKVKSQLSTTKDVKSMDISVKTTNGVVQLSGTQPTDMAVSKAVATAKTIKGVVRVDASSLKSQGTSSRQ